jgi:hypothetical protein
MLKRVRETENFSGSLQDVDVKTRVARIARLRAIDNEKWRPGDVNCVNMLPTQRLGACEV